MSDQINSHMNEEFVFTNEQEDAINSLRDAGCVVVVWQPNEIPEGASDDELEDRAIAAGNDYLSDIASYATSEDEE